ncbi:ESX secretion-associated protein EspG [Nocardia sp. AG03]|uniref:ESX secretion-associated protein EspG n=1 Tax=Nocardia sp. AG03 TaxID=3025312 RepID=UPI0024189422|nr:ESX secretion-associated protein EspG [Nocardia sp. AG03]
MTEHLTWTLTPDEFAALWHRETRLDAFDYPRPLTIRETFMTRAEQQRFIADALSTRFPPGRDQGLSAAFTVLAGADTRLRCSARFAGGLDVRAQGAALDAIGVIVHQYTTATEPSTPVGITLTRRADVPSRLSALLPPTPSGAAGPMLGFTPRVRGEQPPARWGVTPDGRPPIEEQIRSLVLRRRSGEGHFAISRPLGGGRAFSNRYVSFIDVDAGRLSSGRYLITVDENDTRVVPVSPTTLSRELIALTRDPSMSDERSLGG